MSVKDEVLDMLEKNKGCYFSGASLADKLNVSRNAVWKAVKTLKESGYKINSATNKGYCLVSDNDIISSQSIRKFLDDNCSDLNIEVYDSISSTNIVLKEMASNGAVEGCVIVANEQTSGRGRLGRNFYSPSNTGIYLSILLRPNMPANESLFLTTAAAVAVAQSIEDLSNKEAKIKWVNDIYCEGKKVCGILTEGAFNIETGGLDYAVVGIGINVVPPDGGFPDALKDIATSVFSADEDCNEFRSKLIASVLNHFMDLYKNIRSKAYFEEYKKRSFIIGKDIIVISGSNQISATAIDIDEQCRLIVKYKDGTIDTLSSGEVSTKIDKL